MKWFMLFAFLLLPLVVATPHNVYSDFSAAYDINITGATIVVNDHAVFSTGYYASDGDTSWTSFSLNGSMRDAQWINNTGTFDDLPSFGEGEHYILIYSCTTTSEGWDCHGRNQEEQGFWQLRVINASIEDQTAIVETCFDGIQNQGELGVDCGGPCEACLIQEDPYEEEHNFINDSLLEFFFSQDFGQFSDCGDVLDYQCGQRTFCGKEIYYGGCSEGYDCKDNLCIAQEDLSCSGIVCDSGEYCSRGACLLNGTGETYFVSLSGNDSNPGTYEEPFYSWHYAVNQLGAGDVLYIRGGVWKPSEHVTGSSVGFTTRVSGNQENPIRIFNYPRERPIMDGILVDTTTGGWNVGLNFFESSYIHLKGLTVRHIRQVPANTSWLTRDQTEAVGIGCSGCDHFIYENIVVHDVNGRGIEHGDYHSVSDTDVTHFINCDLYNLYDRYSLTPGNRADGVQSQADYPDELHFKGCRAWAFSDDGFDVHGSSYRYFEDTWSMSTSAYEGLSDDWQIEANGYKLPGINPLNVPDYEVGGEPYVIVQRSIAANGVKFDNISRESMGFLNNLQVRNYNTWENNAIYRNNLAYSYDIPYYDGGPSNASSPSYSTSFTNNIGYKSLDCLVKHEYGINNCYEVAIYRPSIYEAYTNTWIPTMESSPDGWPGWEYNPDFAVTDEDFVSLNSWELIRPRKADGSLPDIDFGHLAPGSDLIDGGTIIEGYHCETNGSHLGEDCVEWYGLAPDLGPFEYKE